MSAFIFYIPTKIIHNLTFIIDAKHSYKKKIQKEKPIYLAC